MSAPLARDGGPPAACAAVTAQVTPKPMAEHLSVVMPVYNERYLVAESIRRVLAVESPLISRLDLIIVDDGSKDGTREILRALAAAHPERITYVEHEVNQGKGAAVRTGLSRAEGTVTVIQDA